MRLDADDVAKIKTLIAAGESNGALADRFDVHPRNIADIRAGRTWPHVDALVTVDEPIRDVLGRVAATVGIVLVIGSVADYPNPDVDPDGSRALRWLDRHRRSIATIAARNGVPGRTYLEDGTAYFRVEIPR